MKELQRVTTRCSWNQEEHFSLTPCW